MRAAARDFRHTWWPPSMSVSLYLSRALSLSPSLSGCRSVRRKGHGPPGGDRASRMTSCSIHRPHGHVVQRLAMPRKSSRCAIVNLRGMGAPGSDRWVVLTCLLPACSTGRISCRQMALTLHWGVARAAVAERCASGRAAALQHLVAPKRLHSGRLYIVYNTGQAPRTYVRAMRECDTPRPVTFLEGGGPVGLRVSAVITGKPVGCGRRLGIGLGG